MVTLLLSDLIVPYMPHEEPAASPHLPTCQIHWIT